MNPGSVTVKCCHHEAGCSLGIGDRRIVCLLHDSPANVQWPMTILYSDVEPLSKYSPVTLHLSPATRILNDNPDEGALFISNKGRPGSKFSFVSQASLARKGLMTGLKVVKKSVNHL